MIKFIPPGWRLKKDDPEVHQLTAKLIVDEDGHLVLKLGGIEVLSINPENGKLNIKEISKTESKKLNSKGIKTFECGEETIGCSGELEYVACYGIDFDVF